MYITYNKISQNNNEPNWGWLFLLLAIILIYILS